MTIWYGPYLTTEYDLILKNYGRITHKISLRHSLTLIIFWSIDFNTFLYIFWDILPGLDVIVTSKKPEMTKVPIRFHDNLN